MEEIMNIVFVLPMAQKAPVGGYKVVYEYANRLVNDHNISILYLNDAPLSNLKLPESMKCIIKHFLTMMRPAWFKLDNRIKKISAYDYNLKNSIRDTDVAICTGIDTVDRTIEIFNKVQCKFAYFIQDYENWEATDEYCHYTYGLGMTNIVVSNWLKNIVDKYSVSPSILIKNPIDLNVYKIQTPIESRKLHTIGLLYHRMPYKGLKYSLEALRIIKMEYPDLEVYMFGIPQKPKDFPSWIHYIHNAKQQQTVAIYNKVSVWLCASVDEGFGLTGFEAMACGDALVSTAYTGVFEYAKDGYNALLSPVKNVGALVKNVERLFEDDNLRKSLVDNAQKSIKAFSWDVAVNKLEKAISE